ncbi:hypothetical protein M3Y98_00035100 [Aphelenchoides besseyi]|nr:hypothetical protein M3Y98_00035100 [Aphelenchoides besseyi]
MLRRFANFTTSTVRSISAARTIALETPLPRAKKVVRFEVAQPDDYELVCDHLCWEFAAHEPGCVSLGLTPGELREFAAPLVRDAVHQPYTYLAFDEDRLIAVLMSLERKVDKNANVPLKMRFDYKEVIDSYQSRYSTRRLAQWATILHELEAMTGNLLPEGEDRVLRLEMGGVAPDFERHGIGQIAGIEICRRAYENGFKFTDAQILSSGMTKLLTKLGLGIYCELPYVGLRDNSFPIYTRPMFDGCTAAKFAFGSLEEIVKKSETMDQEYISQKSSDLN